MMRRVLMVIMGLLIHSVLVFCGAWLLHLVFDTKPFDPLQAFIASLVLNMVLGPLMYQEDT